MRTSIAALLVATVFSAVAAASVEAGPTQVNVRIEGKAKTLFEGPVSTDVHKVRASSDSQWRRCNGINVNDPLNTEPGVVPTSASADAMRIIGETFDGLWYNQYEDYFLKRWGPDAQDPAKNEYWGLLVNNVFTSVGGCQYPLDEGDEVLWIYDAFDGRTRLGLYPATYAGNATPLTATAELGQPFEVEVDGWNTASESVPPASPQRTGYMPFQGAEVAPVETGEKGFERVETENPATVVTDAGGVASITFATAGWHRIKATVVDSGSEETVIRSNRLDVCVPQPPASGCGTPPTEDQMRTPSPPVAGEQEDGEDPKEEQPPGGAQGTSGKTLSTSGSTEPGRARLSLLRITRSRIARGLVGVSWTVLDPGPGIEEWTISSKTLGDEGAGWVNRASGSKRTGATLRLPRNGAYRLQLIVIDALGRRSRIPVGKVRVPR
jgi:hypothetical protein